MKFIHITSHFRRTLSIRFPSAWNRVPFSGSSNSHLGSICGCKFYSLSATNPPLESTASTFVQEFAQVLHGDLQSVANHPVSAECQKRLPDLDDQQFLAILSQFDTFFRQNGGNFCREPDKDNPLNKLMLSLDLECCKRFADGDYATALSILETHRFFFATHHSKMIYRLLRRNCKTPLFAPKPLLHRYLAFMNHRRLWDKPFKFYWVEYALQARLDELDVADVCALLQAYIYTLNRFISDDQLLVRIFSKFTNQLDTIHKSHLLVFLLFANRMMYLYQYEAITPHVNKLLNFLSSNFEAYPLTCHINAATLSSKLLLHRPAYLQKICDALVKIPVSVDAFLDVGAAEARTQSNIEISSSGNDHSSGSSGGSPIFHDTEIRPLEPLQSITMEVSERSVSMSNNLPPGQSAPTNSMVTLFPYNESTLIAMHITNFANTVAFFNCTHLAEQLKPFLESSAVKQYFLDANPKLYVCSIAYLSHVGIFSHLIGTFLSEEFMLKTFKRLTKFGVPRHIFFLDATVQIECPDYDGPRVEPELRRQKNDFMVQHCPRKVHFVDRQTFQAIYKMYAYEAAAREYVLYKYTMDEAATLVGDLMGGDEYTHVCRTLPHLSGENLIWCTDAAGKLQKLPAQVKEGKTINFEFIDPELRWFILVCSSRNLHDEGAEPMVVCKEVPKVRQMKLLGFQVVEVVHEEWEMMSREQRISILKEKMGLPITE